MAAEAAEVESEGGEDAAEEAVSDWLPAEAAAVDETGWALSLASTAKLRVRGRSRAAAARGTSRMRRNFCWRLMCRVHASDVTCRAAPLSLEEARAAAHATSCAGCMWMAATSRISHAALDLPGE